MLRYLGRHRTLLDAKICKLTSARAVHWLDFGFNSSSDRPDREIVRLDFLPDTSPARKSWSTVWPTTGTPINWDAVAELSTEEGRAWLLLEAKANIQELQSDCGASDQGGLPLIQRTFDKVKNRLGVPDGADWLRGSYQAANRIAALHHLNEHDEPAFLIFVYFCGDRGDSKRTCPRDHTEWGPALSDQDQHLGLPFVHPLSDRIQKLFLDVNC